MAQHSAASFAIIGSMIRIAWVAGLTAMVLVGCSKTKESGGAATSGGTDKPDATYLVRGRIVELPAGDAKEIKLEHEAVPEFLDRSGKKTGMPAMKMPMSLTDGILTSGLSKGDKVSVKFAVHWNVKPTLRVVALTTLSPETKLVLADKTHGSGGGGGQHHGGGGGAGTSGGKNVKTARAGGHGGHSSGTGGASGGGAAKKSGEQDGVGSHGGSLGGGRGGHGSDGAGKSAGGGTSAYRGGQGQGAGGHGSQGGGKAAGGGTQSHKKQPVQKQPK